MKITNLQDLTIAEIIDCLLISFEGYFVQMPNDLDYWTNRFKTSRINQTLSYGVFDQGKLVAFINNGIDDWHGKKTAFNCGTGVIPAYRGQGLVDQMYQYAIPELQKNDVTRCALEVIQANERAIRVYERIGFHTVKSLPCFKGKLNFSDPTVQIKLVDFKVFQQANLVNQSNYAWDNVDEAVEMGKAFYQTYQVTTAGKTIGYFVVNPENGYLPQVELVVGDTFHNWKKLFSGVQQISKVAKINNVDGRRTNFVSHLEALGLEIPLSQYEMEMNIDEK